MRALAAANRVALLTTRRLLGRATRRVMARTGTASWLTPAPTQFADAVRKAHDPSRPQA